MSESLEGRVFGAYRLGPAIGQGGIGAVYQAVHERTQRTYAVKVLHDADPVALRRFRREAEALGRLRHPGVVAVHDFDEQEGVTYLVMDQLEGQDLAARMDEAGSLSESEALHWFWEIGDALATAHEAGVLHRDLKPSNVFLDRRGHQTHAVLLDFGLAKSMDRAETTKLTATGQTMGTPLYMSPEQALGEGIDERSDVYSLAAMLYEMVSGHPPFEGPTVTAILSKLLTAPTPPLRAHGVDVSERVEAAVLAGLSKNKDDRPPTVRALMEMAVDRPSTSSASSPVLPATMTSVQTPRSVSVGSELPMTRATPTAVQPARRTQRWPWVVASLMVVLGGGLGTYFALASEGTTAATTTAPTPVPTPATEGVPPSVEVAPVGDDEGANVDDTTPVEELGAPENTRSAMHEVPSTPSRHSTMSRRAAQEATPVADMNTAMATVVPENAPNSPTLPPEYRAQLERNIGDQQRIIAETRETIRYLHTLPSKSTAYLCGSSFTPRENMTPRYHSVLCDLVHELEEAAPEREAARQRLLARMAYLRRSLASRNDETLLPPDRAELTRRMDAVERVVQRPDFDCDADEFDALQQVASELGAVRAQPGLELVRGVTRICVRVRQLPDRERRWQQSIRDAIQQAEERIRTHEGIIDQMRRTAASYP